MYFGIPKPEHHTMLKMTEPLQDGVHGSRQHKELWTGFGDQMACTWDWTPSAVLILEVHFLLVDWERGWRVFSHFNECIMKSVKHPQ